MRRGLLIFFLVLQAGIAQSAVREAKPCPAGHIGNLMDKFTGDFSSNRSFKYTAQRRYVAKWAVLGILELDHVDYQFNLYVKNSVLTMELYDPNGKGRVFSGDVCGNLVRNRVVEIRISHQELIDIDNKKDWTFIFEFSKGLRKFRAFSHYHSSTNYPTGLSDVKPVVRYKLKKN